MYSVCIVSCFDRASTGWIVGRFFAIINALSHLKSRKDSSHVMRIPLLNVAKAVVSGDGAQVEHPGTFVYMSKRGMLLFIR